MHFNPDVFWPYFGAVVALLLGLVCSRRALGRARGGEVLVVLAPVFVAMGIAVFGADHLVEPRAVAGVVPAWMFWREFWAVLVGVALVAAALGLAAGVFSDAAAGMLGFMILCFALLVFFPVWLRHPGARTWQTLLLRDLTLGSALFAFGMRRAAPIVPTIARFVVAFGVGVYGVSQFTHPEAAPGIPQDGPNLETMPVWMPAHHAWSYATGAMFLGCALLLLFARKVARHAALALGFTVTVLFVAIYLPITLAKPADIENGLDYLAIHLLLAGALLLLSEALRPAKSDS